MPVLTGMARQDMHLTFSPDNPGLATLALSFPLVYPHLLLRQYQLVNPALHRRGCVVDRCEYRVMTALVLPNRCIVFHYEHHLQALRAT